MRAGRQTNEGGIDLMTNGFLFPLSSAISSGQKRESERLVLLGGRSLTRLAKFCPLLTTYLPTVDIGEGITLLFLG